MLLLQLTPLNRPVAIAEIVLLLAGSAFVGWLLARWVMASRVNGLREAIADRQNELDECEAKQQTAASSVAGTTVPDLIHSESGTLSGRIQSVADNLKLVEGIGPKIEGLLNADGIKTFAKLAATNPQHIAGLLSAAGPRFQIHDPETWPQQAALARDGKWEELKELQEKLVGGRD
ncbi:hypothetical protein [Salmonirosea aquatica]|uniref:DUF4332 domain-containing protein n=1 Tax=Salmonirosea aquatica TaxID=2654236 RepID=A0A7C9BER0_9BACT|nr:hypothetical protein [Cytophagaceae bacterium SJW1-29]